MKKWNLFVMLFAVGALMCLAAPKQASARPQYLKAFIETYPKLAEKAMELKCGVCHGDSGKNKKTVSDYGKALAEALGEKNVKGEEAIAKALEETGKKDAGDGKTYAELFAEGTLPPPKK